MEKNRKVKGIVILVLVAVIVSLTVAFATLSKELTISGNAYLDPIKWGLKFQNISVLDATDLVKEDIKTPTIDTSDPTKINGLEIAFTKPRQKVEYEVELVNESDVQVEIANINKSELSYEYIEFNVKYKDENKELAVGDVISANSIYKLIITVYYNDENITKETLPTASINLNLSYKVNFVQSEKDINITTTTKAVSTIPVVTVQLGDNVYATYDNGDVKITGSGDMNEGKVISGGFCDTGMGAEFCSLNSELSLKLVEKLGTNDENYNNALSFALQFYIGGYSESIAEEDLISMLEQYNLTSDQNDKIIEIIKTIPTLKSLTIENGITSIRNNLFMLIETDEIIIPNSVSKITGTTEDVHCVFCMVNVNNLSVGNGIKTVEDFIHDSYIKNLDLSEGILAIKASALDGTFDKITIPSTVTAIETYAIRTRANSTIVNKTGKAFDWNGILGDTSSDVFETGTVEVNGRTITIIDK